MPKVVTVNGTSIVVDPLGYEGFWDGVAAGRWEPEMFSALDRLLDRQWRMVDIGAWIGPLTLYSARKCARVDAYECDPVALKVLGRNLDENPDISHRIAVHEFAVGPEDGFATLYSRALGNSETSLLRRHERDSAVIECAESFDCGVRDVLTIFRDKGYASDDRTFVKIDVEGAEFRLVDRLRPIIASSRCTWCVSVHELNINPQRLPAGPVRASETIRLLDAFAELEWFDLSMQPLDKSAVLRSVLEERWPIHQCFLFSRNPLLTH